MRCNDGYKFSTNVREVNVTCGTTDWIYPPGYPESSFPQCEGLPCSSIDHAAIRAFVSSRHSANAEHGCIRSLLN